MRGLYVSFDPPGPTRPPVRRIMGGNWSQLRPSVRQAWPLLTEQDVDAIAGERDELLRLLQAYYKRSYSELEREVTEFELGDSRAINTRRVSLGIVRD